MTMFTRLRRFFDPNQQTGWVKVWSKPEKTQQQLDKAFAEYLTKFAQPFAKSLLKDDEEIPAGLFTRVHSRPGTGIYVGRPSHFADFESGGPFTKFLKNDPSFRRKPRK